MTAELNRTSTVGQSSPRQSSLYQSLATSGAVLVTFIGVCHEVVGTALFPWGPSFFGGIVGWHAVGIACIAVGLGLIGGTLRLVRFPVVTVALVIGVAGLAIAVFTAVTRQQFHLFAITLALAAVVMAYCHRADTDR